MSEAPMIVWLEGPGDTSAKVLGGKFSSLAEMTAAGFAVPAGFGVTTGAWQAFVDHNDLAGEFREATAAVDTSDLAAVEAVSAKIAARLDAAAMPPELEGAITDAYAELERRMGATDLPVAVRSSGVSEDLEGASFAGQYDTFLWIIGAAALLEHVKKCWAGIFGPQVLTYHPHGVDVGNAGMCVGVQAMVAAKAAGVMFTLDPLNGDRSKIVIEACWGLGEGVVSGDVTPDRFRVDKVTLELLSREASPKLQEHAFDAASGKVVLRDVADELREVLCLTDEHVVELAALGKKIERHRKGPCDIEWAVDQEGRVHVLQVRPETVWSSKQPKPVTAGRPSSGMDRVLAKFMTGAGAKS